MIIDILKYITIYIPYTSPSAVYEDLGRGINSLPAPERFIYYNVLRSVINPIVSFNYAFIRNPIFDVS